MVAMHDASGNVHAVFHCNTLLEPKDWVLSLLCAVCYTLRSPEAAVCICICRASILCTHGENTSDARSSTGSATDPIRGPRGEMNSR